MAEESKSWFPNIGILSDSSLIGIPAEMQDQLQREASKRMLIGGLLSGRPDIGFQSAIGTANDYAASQQRLMDLAEKQRQLQEESAWTAKYNPTKYQETSPEFAGPVAPDVSAYQTSIGRARAAGLPTADVNAALRDLTTMRSPRQAAMLEGFKASLPKIGEGGTMLAPSGQYLGTIPQFSPSQGIVYGTRTDEQGRIVPFSQEIPGAIQTRGRITATETQARELNTPRTATSASGAQTFIYPQAPNGVGGSGAIEPVQTEADRIRLEADKKRFGEFSAQSSDAALSATDRKLAGERIYSLADSINGTKFTNLTSEAAGYLRALPWVGDKFDSYVADVSLFNRDRANMVLRGLSNVKGNANESENRVVSQASVSVTDPKIATKYVAALEMAAADKDLARQNFVENFKGDPGKIQTAWQNSPDNPRIYNHPKVDQFLTDQIKANPAKPVLPAGFSLVQNKDKQYGVRKPDGSVMPLQIGQ